jgi:hypothetical protein
MLLTQHVLRKHFSRSQKKIPKIRFDLFVVLHIFWIIFLTIFFATHLESSQMLFTPTASHNQAQNHKYSSSPLHFKELHYIEYFSSQLLRVFFFKLSSHFKNNQLKFPSGLQAFL